MNFLPRPKVRIEMRETYPEFFGKLEGKSWTFSFQRGENGAVVMDFGLEDALASTDRGRTWHGYEGKQLWPSGAFEVFSVGEEWVAILGDQSVSRSTDGGLTWSEPQPIEPAKSEHYPNLKGPYVFSIEVTRKGRIIIPEDYLTGREGPDPDVLFSNVSDDAGRTWRRSPIIEPPALLPKAPEGFGEPAAVELADGTIWMVFRSLYGHLWQCFSTDGGLTWGPLSSTGLASPLSNVKAKRIPGSDSVVLFWNFARPGPSRNFGDNPGIYRPRAPLVFAVSHDGCRTWSCPTVIYEGTGTYPSIHFTDQEMFVLFSSNPDPAIGAGAKYGLTLGVYEKQEVLSQPAWTQETIQPYIDDGRVAHWLGLNLP